MVKSLACAIVFALAVGGTAPGAASQERRIVPGRSMGDLSIGQNVTNLFSTLGPLYSSEDLPNADLAGYYWPLKRVAAIASRESNRIVALAISLDDTYTTDGGIGAGARLDAVRRLFGPEDEVEPAQAGEMFVYDALGIAFVVEDAGALEGRVSAVFIFLPGHSHDIFPL